MDISKKIIMKTHPNEHTAMCRNWPRNSAIPVQHQCRPSLANNTSWLQGLRIDIVYMYIAHLWLIMRTHITSITYSLHCGVRFGKWIRPMKPMQSFYKISRVWDFARPYDYRCLMQYRHTPLPGWNDNIYDNYIPYIVLIVFFVCVTFSIINMIFISSQGSRKCPV